MIFLNQLRGIRTVLLLCLPAWMLGSKLLSQPSIVLPRDRAGSVQLAAKEVRRYVFLRTGQLLSLSRAESIPSRGDIILVAPDSHPFVEGFRNAIGGVAPDLGFIIKSIESGGRSILVIAGDDPVCTLYGAYRFAENLGVSFGLAQDSIPDQQIALELSGFDEAGKPLLKIRGILPFHDFPEGPDFWSSEDYGSVIGQLPKLGMNFIGLHNYPRWGTTEEKEREEPQGPEPAVWIGLPQDINDDGTVNWAYPAYWAHTHRPDQIWGFSSCDTSKFHAGASQVFSRDGYGSRVFKNGKMPIDLESSKELFNRVGAMFDEAFTHAKHLGVKTALGTELPLGLEPGGPEVQHDWVRGMPPELQNRLKDMGKTPRDPAVVKDVYKGIFQRIMNAHPLDYYWLWSWEVWSRYGVSEEQIAAFERDMQIAYAALQELNAPFQLAHAGWIIGTSDNPAEFDDALPSDVPFFGLWDEAMGFEHLRKERVKWAATWFEEDWGLVQPQFELTRIYKDVKASIEKGCEGLIGKHWRTRVLSMNCGAMKDLLWNYAPVGSEISNKLPEEPEDWMINFYQNWAQRRFGPEAAEAIAEIFSRLDQSGVPTASGWDAAPGAIISNETDWTVQSEEYEFVDEMAALLPKIQGSGNRARFQYWLNTFKAFRLIGKYGTLRSDFQEALNEDADAERALKIREAMARLWEEIIALELARITNQSELGEIVNLEVLNWYQLMRLQWDDVLKESLGRPIPLEAKPSREYRGPPLVRLLSHRTQLYPGEELNARAVVLGNPESVQLHWRALGKGEFKTQSCHRIARAVYRISLPPQRDDFEYYVEAKTAQGSVVYPVSAPKLNQTIVVSGES